MIVQVVLTLYFQAILWLPLGAWNDQRGDRLITLVQQGHAVAALSFALAMLTPTLFFVAAVWKRWFWLMWLGLIGYVIWAIMQIQSWWLPWLFGPNARDLANAKALERTYKIFPSSPQHLAPDAMHFVLDALLFAAIGTLAIGLFEESIRSRKRLRA